MKPRSCLPVCIHLQVGLLNFTLCFVYQSLIPAKLFHILSLSINNFIPLTTSCFITRCSHCLLSSPDHLRMHWTAQAPAPGSTGELPSVQELSYLVTYPCKELLSYPMDAEFHQKHFVENLMYSLLELSGGLYLSDQSTHLFIDPFKETQNIF